MPGGIQKLEKLKYRPFHKTLLRPSAFVNWILVRFYETGCSKKFTDNEHSFVLGKGSWILQTLPWCLILRQKLALTFNIFNYSTLLICTARVLCTKKLCTDLTMETS